MGVQTIRARFTFGGEKQRVKLLVFDIDNTIFDWVSYYVNAFSALLLKLEEIIHVPYLQLAGEAKDVFHAQRSIEYPFVVQQMPSVLNFYGADIDRLLTEAVEPTRLAFNAVAREHLKPYPEVVSTLQEMRGTYPGIPFVVLTDAPRYVAMWKLNKLKILNLFDAVYGLPDPKLPTSTHHGRVLVDPEILLKHLRQEHFNYQGRIRILPEDYEKPGTKGLKTVLIDYELDGSAEDRRQVVWVGDNLRKDIGLGRALGVVSVWAKFGIDVSAELKTRLLDFSPDGNVKKNVYLDPQSQDAPQPDFIIESFGQIKSVVAQVKT